MMLAAIKGHKDVVEVLAPLETGMQAKLGNTALMGAAENGFVEIIRLLEKE